MQHRLLFVSCFAAFALGACQDQVVTRPGTPKVDAGPSGGEDEPEPEPEPADASIADAPFDTTQPPACTTTFGSALTPAHGRLDGTVRAVVVPGTFGCRHDDDHVIVQVDVVEGAATVTYPVWINVYSNIAVNDPAVRVAQATKPLVGPAWASGWHPNVTLDYATSLGMHTTSGFAPKTKAELGALVASSFPAGTKVSAFMYGFDTGDGGHKVHRNVGGDDGAIVAIGAGTPKWLLFHFSQQAF